MPTKAEKLLTQMGRLRRSQFTFPGLLAVWGLAILLLLLLILPRLLVSWDVGSGRITLAERIAAIGTARTTLIQGIAVALVGAYFTWRQIQTNREEKITERFSTAIDQLNSDQLHVRLGAIYVLERIAQYSPKDQHSIVLILTAYVRLHSSWSLQQEDSDLNLRVQAPLPLRAPDVQAILTVLGRGDFAQNQGQSLNLRYTNLSQADLGSAQLRSAQLQGANLQEANLQNAQLQGANLENADLSGANFSGADLAGASLRNANLADTVLDEANLTGSSLDRSGPESPE